MTAVASIPIMHGGVSAGKLLVGSSTYTEFPSVTLAALDVLGKMAGGAVANLAAKQLHKEMRAYLQALLHFFPLPVWCVNDDLEVCLWNRAAERVFGWKEEEVLRAPIEFSSDEVHNPLESFLQSALIVRDAGEHQFQCLSKHGRLLRVVAAAMPAPHRIEFQGTGLGRVVVAEVSDAAPSPSFADAGDSEQTLISFPERTVSPKLPDSNWPRRILVVDQDGEQRRVLVGILSDMGSFVTQCASTAAAIALCDQAAASKHRFDMVIGELIPAAGCGGLELAGSLWKIDPRVSVVLSADSPIAGLVDHGLAGALRRPFTKEAVLGAMAGVLTSTRSAPKDRM
jgi:PAS domain S-box-containing protein